MSSSGAVGDPPQHCSIPPQGHLSYTQTKPIHPTQQLQSKWCNSERKGCQLPRKDDHNNLSSFIIRDLLRLSGGQKDNRHPHRMEIGSVPQFLGIIRPLIPFFLFGGGAPPKRVTKPLRFHRSAVKSLNDCHTNHSLLCSLWFDRSAALILFAPNNKF